jgi:uncharacterized protein (DUF1684 family)
MALMVNALVAVLLVLPMSDAVVPARPVKLSAAEAKAVAAGILEVRQQSEESLRSGVSSYLATVQRVDFGEKTRLTVGRAADNDVRIDAEGIADHHLEVTVSGDRFRVRAVDGAARFVMNDRETREAVVDPSSIRVGRFTLRLSHQRFPAIIVFDPESPRFKEYKGLKYFPVDLSYRYELALTRNPAPRELVILSTLGHRRRAELVGWFDFLVGDNPCRLEVTRLLEPGVGENDLIVLFRDATSGKESYPLGRYLDPKRLPDGKYLLDFNVAYNPACAYSDHYNCPIPPRGNTLEVAIRAGEMDSKYH